MKELKLTISADTLPPSPASVQGTRAALEDLKRTVSGLAKAAIGLTVLGFLGLEVRWIAAAMPEALAKASYALGLIIFLLSHEYEKVVARRLAEVSPIEDTLLAEAVLLANASPTAREYIGHLRQQKRELTLAELKALRKLVSESPADSCRQKLYG